MYGKHIQRESEECQILFFTYVIRRLSAYVRIQFGIECWIKRRSLPFLNLLIKSELFFIRWDRMG